MPSVMYDPIMESLRYDYLMKLSIMNEEFQQYIDRLQGQDDGVLLEASQEWYNEWKITYISGIKANLSRFQLYLKSQNGKYSKWLAENKSIILDYNKYPPKNKEAIKSAPNYKLAITRLNKPITSSLNGINLNRVVLDQGKDKNRSNLWIKKLLIPEYNDNEGTFVSFAKDYYCGNDNKVKISLGSIPQVLEMAFNYCFNFNTILRATNVEANGLISYINNDPLTGQQNQPNTNKPNSTPQQGGIASTNPNVNAGNTPVNAAYDQYSLFMKEFFNEDIAQSNQASTSPTANPVSKNNNMIKSNNPVKSKIFKVMNKNNDSTDKDNKIKESDIYKKKRYVCDIVKDAFNAKMTAYGIIYKNFMDILQTHVNEYSKNANVDTNQQKQAVSQVTTNNSINRRIK